jgi:hypothetical protein
MSTASHLPLRYDLDVPPDGRIEVQLPLPSARQVTVFVVERSDDDLNDLLNAATSSTDFWDNPDDDEDWNDA